VLCVSKGRHRGGSCHHNHRKDFPSTWTGDSFAIECGVIIPPAFFLLIRTFQVPVHAIRPNVCEPHPTFFTPLTMSETIPKKEKKEKKRKSEAAVEPIPVPPEEGTASAEVLMMEVDGEKALKKSKKEKRKSTGGEGGEDEKEKKVS